MNYLYMVSAMIQMLQLKVSALVVLTTDYLTLLFGRQMLVVQVVISYSRLAPSKGPLFCVEKNFSLVGLKNTRSRHGRFLFHANIKILCASRSYAFRSTTERFHKTIFGLTPIYSNHVFLA